ncbi:Thylakoid lumenal protein [Apostasia shenzhenica]|uniref:Thylakoid lumenal protein n=1 Tax=Apostasia shenzhenica TaxID=1088818 RepID=A0A2I0BFD4_9ASPA|nr:Thylakoid lumenal protein [Apostasia shenzhenica]
MASLSLATLVSKPKTLIPYSKYHQSPASNYVPPNITTISLSLRYRCSGGNKGRREMISLVAAGLLAGSSAVVATGASAASDEEYVKETTDVINKVRSTVNMDRKDPNVGSAVADLREASNSWVAKYRREKALLGRASFRDMYSALNAVSGHYISFGPTAPIPAKRKARILEEVDTAEKALLRGR